MDKVEATRSKFRPDRITTLFVGESAPAGGDFFYYGNSAMTRHMKRVVDDTLGAGGDFLARFQSYGWYLDDLVLTPVDKLENAERKMRCLEARPSLAARIAEYRPLAIVSLLLSTRHIVDAAAIDARSAAPRYAVPFPGMGQQARFRTAMVDIIPKLPRLP
jgi:hypothetical protein